MAESAASEVTRRAGERAGKNTVVRAAAEILGRLASLVLFAALGRKTGESGLGVFVFALAWVQIATVPIGIGMDRYLLRRIATDHSQAREVINLVALKLALAVPIAGSSLAVVALLDYDSTTLAAVAILTVAMLFDLLQRSFFSAFNARERGGLHASCLLVQRFAAAGLGLAALAAGLGVIAVACAYAVGATLALLLAILLFHGRIARVSLSIEPRRWRTLMKGSLPFGAQDVSGILLAKLDVVLLSLLATEVAVGSYGACYRLLESTFFVSFSIIGAFAAMFTYLGHDTQPTVGSAFQRSIKLSLAILAPCAVAMAVLAEPLLTVLFGQQFAGAADVLRLLAPNVVLMSLVYLSASLIVSRRDPRIMAAVIAAAVCLNVPLNLLLIPAYGATGAATAMLVTELLLAPVALTLAIRAAGAFRWATLPSPLLASALMSVPMLLLGGDLALALLTGGALYLVTLIVLERLISPADLNFTRDLLKRTLPARFAA